MLDDGGRPRKYTEKEKDNLLSWGIHIKADEWEVKAAIEVNTTPPLTWQQAAAEKNNLADLFAKAAPSSSYMSALQMQQDILNKYGLSRMKEWQARQQGIGVSKPW